MPRRQPVERSVDANEEPAQSYLDNFLNRVTEETDLPSELKTALKQLRDLDTQAQELYEKMQKQSKNYIARAKRSVQSGQAPDEELLHKARKLHRELLQIDEQKKDIAEASHASICKHLAHCEGELQQFAEERLINY